ncbi:uncharacterized protein [Drosophila kikkawai]|uniref:Uncharacterized protein n=1 Tax=Drosophila kikkawai TaxID=30033 RepID=A0ABM3C8J0_DROKI|nr:uncharacterized protein LOC121503223 [Drosophila kikkawai]
MAIGQHFMTSGSSYKLLRLLGLLEDRSAVYSRGDSLELARLKAMEVMGKQNAKNERQYNLRARDVVYAEGQEVYRKNFKQSSFPAGYSSKLGPAYIKARVRKKLGNSCYELENLNGRTVGRFHAKDMRQ